MVKDVKNLFIGTYSNFDQILKHKERIGTLADTINVISIHFDYLLP